MVNSVDDTIDVADAIDTVGAVDASCLSIGVLLSKFS
jgi:hypothetical protein